MLRAGSTSRRPWSEARRWAAARSLAALTLIGTALGATTGIAGATTATTPRSPVGATAFTCTQATVFIAQGSPTVLQSETFALGATASFANVGSASGWKYNGIAFDVQDSFIYASSLNIDNPQQFPAGHLLKIDSTGAVTDLGLFPNRLEGQTAGWVAATFDETPGTSDDGIYYATDPGTVPSSDLYELPITNGVPGTATNFTLNAGGQTVTPSLYDLTYADGFLWGVDAGSGDAHIDRIDPADGDVTAVTQSVLPTGIDSYGADWTLGNGDIGFSDNDTGNIYTVAIHDPSGTPTFSLVANSTGPASPTNSDGTACPGENVDLGIVKSATASVAPGGALSYSLVVTNHGPGASSGYTVSDDVPTAVTGVRTSTAGCTVTVNDVSCVEGALADGASFTVTVTGTAPTTTGNVTNTATVTGDEVDPNQSNNTSSATTVVGRPDVTLTKSVSSSTPSFGGTDTFTLTASNSGPVAAGKVVVTDQLPSGLQYDSSTASSGSVSDSGQTVTWTIPNLAALGGNPASATLSIVVTVDTTSAVTNTATFTQQVPGPSGTTKGSSNTVSVGAQSAVLDLTKTVDHATPTTASEVNYTLVVTNAGPDAADGVVLDDTLPSGLSYVSSSTLPSSSPAPTVSSSGVITWDVGALALDATATLDIVAKVTAVSGTIVNTATVTSTTYDPDGQTRTATASLVVASGSVVPPTHTGEPWAGADYWAIMGGIGAGGTALVLVGRRRRRRRPLHAR